jgi:dihydroorotate dehydrogenase (NAD+) catalytic subunit
VDLSRIGGVVTKSVTTKPRRGNPPPRIHETAAGMLNSIGIMNPGLAGFIAEVLPKFRELPCVRIVNVAGETQQDFVTLTESLGNLEGVDAIELNVSCPNVSGGLDFGIEPRLLEPLVAACRAATGKPLLVKLTPNVTDIAGLAVAAERGGADALSLVNTYQGLAVNWRRRKPELGSLTGEGGLSGPAIKPLALSAVRKVRAKVGLPLVGIGGITSAEDVMEFVVTGASAVQVGTSNFRDPAAPVRILEELLGLVDRGEVQDLATMVGTLCYGARPQP